MPRKGKPKHKRRNVSQGQCSPGTTHPGSAPPSPYLSHQLNRVLSYQQRKQKWLATDMNIQAIIPKPGTRQLRSRTIATRDVQQESSI